MQIGVIGLGRMGGNITRRLMQHGHEAVVYDHDARGVAAEKILSAMRMGFGAHVEPTPAPEDRKAKVS
jgi:6-phosphogluconate dehydrogenase (decarboxylating)